MHNPLQKNEFYPSLILRFMHSSNILACIVCNDKGYIKYIECECYDLTLESSKIIPIIFCDICRDVYQEYGSGVFRCKKCVNDYPNLCGVNSCSYNACISPYKIKNKCNLLALTYARKDTSTLQQILHFLEFKQELFEHAKKMKYIRSIVSKLGYYNKSIFSILPYDVISEILSYIK